MTYPRPTLQGTAALVQVHYLLCQAEAEALARAQDTGAVRDENLASVLRGTATDVHQLFSDGVVPAFDQWPHAQGADPLELLAQAERLTRDYPIAHFPPGTSAVVAQLIDTIRDFS